MNAGQRRAWRRLRVWLALGFVGAVLTLALAVLIGRTVQALAGLVG